MNKMTHAKFNLNNFMMALSPALDKTVGKNIHENEFSSQRLSFIALRLGALQGLEPSLMSDLFSYSIICKNTIAKKNISSFNFINKDIHLNNDILNIIDLALLVEDNLNIQNNIITDKANLIDTINSNISLSKQVKENFVLLKNDFSFWLDLTANCKLPFYIFNLLADFTVEISYIDLIQLSEVISNIINEYSHKSTSKTTILSKATAMSKYYAFDEKDEARFIIAAALHNIGLLFISKDILRKKEKLNDDELDIVHSTSYHTNSVLEQVFGFDDIAKLASSFACKLDGSGYPNAFTNKDLGLKERLMASLSIHQALEESRAYRDAFNTNEIYNILNEKAKKGLLDASIIEDIKSNIIKN